MIGNNINGHAHDTQDRPATVGHLSFAAPALSGSTESATVDEPSHISTVIEQGVNEGWERADIPREKY